MTRGPGRAVRVLLIDNFDSFVWNLAQGLGALGAEVLVLRNDARSPADIAAMEVDAVVLSPGPRGPLDAGVSVEVIRTLPPGRPLLGVCLGHQCIAEAYGAVVARAPRPVHGRDDAVHHAGAGVLRGLPRPFRAARYHSLAVREEALPGCLEITARTADGVVMGLRHRALPVEGVQFHPESFLTPEGPRILGNFLEACRR